MSHSEPEAPALLPTLTLEQRDALRDHVAEVTGMAAVARALLRGESPPLSFEEGIRLCSGLGWDQPPSGVVRLALPRDALRSMVERVGAQLPNRLLVAPERTDLAAQACVLILDAL